MVTVQQYRTKTIKWNYTYFLLKRRTKLVVLQWTLIIPVFMASKTQSRQRMSADLEMLIFHLFVPI